MEKKLDKGLLLVILFLLGLGLVQVYSSSYIYAIESFGDGLFFFRRQLGFALAGALVLAVTAKIPMQHWKYLGLLVWLLAVIGVCLTLVPGFGHKVGGAVRWIKMPMGFRFEPGELLKVSYPCVVGLALLYREKFQHPAAKTLGLALLAAPLVLLLQQPDFGTLVICSLVIFTLFFAFGLQWRYIILSLGAAIPAFYFLVVTSPYRYARLQAFLDPWADPEQKGFQVIQSMLSFHSGGVTGVGLGAGQGKLFFLPEAHNDFTFAVLGEELGFIGVVFVLLLFGYIVFRGLQITVRAKNVYHQALAMGLTVWFGVSVFINVGVSMGLLPPKGMTLPFLSYGGSSLLCTCFGLGLLLNVERQLRQKKKVWRGFQLS